MTTPRDFRSRFSKSSGPAPLPRQRNSLDILVDEPDVTVARQLVQMLQPRHRVTAVSSMQAALTVLESYRPHLMLTELDLPDGSSFDLLARVYQTSAWHHILLLVITSRNTLHDKIAAFEVGADEYLIKPITAVYLSEHVERLSLFGQVIRN